MGGNHQHNLMKTVLVFFFLCGIVFSVNRHEKLRESGSSANIPSAVSDSTVITDEDDIYISTAGTDTVGCGSGPGAAACLTILFAFTNIQTYPKDFILEPGTYIENGTIDVAGDVGIWGLHQTEVCLAKTYDGWFPFIRLNTPNANLTVHNITIVLNDHSVNYGEFRSDNGNMSVTFTFYSVLFTMNKTLSKMWGRDFTIINSQATLLFEDCHFYNITTTSTCVVYATFLDELILFHSSFINIVNEGSAVDPEGGVFAVSDLDSLYIMDSLFAGCSSGARTGGVGSVSVLRGVDNEIRSVSFWNVTAEIAGGVLWINSTEAAAAPVTIKNCSLVNCSSLRSFGGGFFFGNYLFVYLTTTNFIGCSALGNSSALGSLYGGGAICIDGLVTLNVTRCVFVNNSAPAGYGGALSLWNSSLLSIFDTVFSGNTALENSTGLDIYFGSTIPYNFTGVFTDIPSDESCNAVDCTIISADYNQHPCASEFKDPLENMSCPMPCANSYDEVYACVWPSLCPPDFLPIHNACVPLCAFWVPAPSVVVGDPARCGELCTAVAAQTPSVMWGTELCAALCDPELDEAPVAEPGAGCRRKPKGGGGGGGGGGKPPKKKANPAAVVATVLVILVAVTIIAIVVVWLCLRKKKNSTGSYTTVK